MDTSINPKLSILIPVYNEAENIVALLTDVATSVTTDYEILIIYDYAEDSTLPAIRNMAGGPRLKREYITPAGAPA
jgi:glycosyltransferase involved in cell wall biosynthesis